MHRNSLLPSGYLDRLAYLLAKRLQPDANQADIDQRIWDLFGERWTILFSDLAGFSRNVEEFGIIHFLQNIFESQRLLFPMIDDHDGVLIKTEGDSLMVLFRQPAKAVACALAMQRATHEYNLSHSPPEQLLLCLGLGYGDILTIGEQDVFGQQVNAASKLGEDLAKAGEILVTEAVQQALPQYQWQPLLDRPLPSGLNQAYKLDY